jgi:hypothetical protein
MSKDWDTFSVKYFAVPMTALVFGMVIGLQLANSKKKPQKEYPVKVNVCYETKGYWYNDVVECDSVKGDTIYKDSLCIINKNIVNITFK